MNDHGIKMKNKGRTKQNKILFLLPFTLDKAPAQRFRAEAYFDLLAANGFEIEWRAFFGEGSWETLYGSGSGLQKGWLVLKGFFKRFYHVFFIVPRYDFIFLQREAAPLGPPVFEWIIAKLLRKKMIFDFDDAMWIPNIPNKDINSKFVSWFKAFWKIGYICKWSYKVVPGNNYLGDYAKKFSDNVVIIPTVIDTVNTYIPVQQKNKKKLVVGWTGSHSTLIYLPMVTPVLEELQKKYAFNFLVIANKNPELKLRDWSFVKWNTTTEISDLQKIDIGIMPLTSDKWSEGKCGFKVIQYLGLGIPAIASPVGVNKEIIEQEINGFLAEEDNEWSTYLETLIADAELRKRTGESGRKKIVENYSIISQQQRFLSLFE